MKKWIGLSALVCCLLTGNMALAADITVAEGETKDLGENVQIATGEKFTNNGTAASQGMTVAGTFDNTSTGIVTNTGTITIDKGVFKNAGTIHTDKLDILGGSHPNVIFTGGTINAKDSIIYRGTQTNNFGVSLNDTVLDTPLLTIQGDAEGHQIGLSVVSSDNLKNVDRVDVISEGGKTGLIISGSDVNITSEVHLTGDAKNQDARIEVYDGASASFDTVYSDGGRTKIQANNASSVSVDNIIVSGTEEKTGNLSLQTNSGKDQYATFTLQNITVGDNALFKTCVYGDNAGAHIIGENININLGTNATADFGAVSSADWHGKKINFDANKLTVNVNGTGSHVYLSDVSKIENKNITVIGDASQWTGNAQKDLTNLAGVVTRVTDTADTADTGNPYYTTSAVSGATVQQNGGEIDDGYKGIVGSAEGGQAVVNHIQVIKNANVYGIAENNALSLMTWRSQMDDLNKRMGELRSGHGERGLWVRMVRGESEYGSIKNQYNTYQLGYDEKLGADSSWTVGGAVSYTDGDSSYSTGSAENTHKGFALYGTKLNDDGSFLDIIAKYANIDNDFRTTIGKGSFDSDAYSASVEYGKRFTKDNGFWFEPQVQLSYGTVSSADYSIGNVKVNQDGVDSLVGRLGFGIGKNIERGNVYLRASYLYDFDGETSVSYTGKEGTTRTLEQDFGGGWWEVGVGTNISLSDATYLYLDVERTFGGDIDTPWQWNAGVRWSF